MRAFLNTVLSTIDVKVRPYLVAIDANQVMIFVAICCAIALVGMV